MIYGPTEMAEMTEILSLISYLYSLLSTLLSLLSYLEYTCPVQAVLRGGGPGGRSRMTNDD